MSEPRLYLTADGSEIDFVGGVPRIDPGLENSAEIQLFTELGWAGNMLMPDSGFAVGSDFEKTASGTLTMAKLNNIRNSAERALSGLGKATAEVSNPRGSGLSVKIRVEPPSRDPQVLALSRLGTNWLSQGAAA